MFDSIFSFKRLMSHLWMGKMKILRNAYVLQCVYLTSAISDKLWWVYRHCIHHPRWTWTHGGWERVWVERSHRCTQTSLLHGGWWGVEVLCQPRGKLQGMEAAFRSIPSILYTLQTVHLMVFWYMEDLKCLEFFDLFWKLHAASSL